MDGKKGRKKCITKEGKTFLLISIPAMSNGNRCYLLDHGRSSLTTWVFI